jgi:hypothetical protein
MIRFIIFRLWPAFLPLLVYIIWHRLKVRQAKKDGLPPPHFRDGPIYWVVLACLGLAAASFIFFGAEMEERKGVYVPPMMRDGKLVPGHIQ